MKIIKNTIVLVTLLFFYFNSFAQNTTSLFKNYKGDCNKLDSLYSTNNTNKNKVLNANVINNVKLNILRLKKELKKSKNSEGILIKHLDSKILGDNFELLDGYLYDWSTDKYRIVCRIRSITKVYSDFVKLTFKFYKNNVLVGSDYSYIDYETYGYSGMLPYHISIMETFADKVDHDRTSVEISYSIKDGTGDILWDQILELKTCQINIGTYLNEWNGSIKNNSNYSVKFPKIFACIFNDGNMIDMDYTYLDDLDNYLLPANTTGTFDSYIDLPTNYDEIKYYLSYSLYSLEGSGNITSNWPTFTQMSYIDSASTPAYFDIFLIDHEKDNIKVKIDWGDNSNTIWSNSFLSGSVTTINHTYTQPGTYFIKCKSKDRTNSESIWSDELKIEILDAPSSIDNIDNSFCKNFSLEQNYPNPFNPKTIISFNLPKKAYIRLTIYNLIGKEIDIIVNKEYSAGHHEIIFNSSNLASGLYLYKLEADDFVRVKKLSVLK